VPHPFKDWKSSAVALEAAASLGRRMSDAVWRDVDGALSLGAGAGLGSGEGGGGGGDDNLKETVLQREIVTSPLALLWKVVVVSGLFIQFHYLLIHHPLQC
jgi:hypothetical protein